MILKICPQFDSTATVHQKNMQGSVDNISVIMIVFRDGIYQIGASTSR